MCVLARVVVASIALAMIGASSWAEVGPTTVGRLAASSEIVVIGTVERVLEFPVPPMPFAGETGPPPSIRVAQVAVQEWLEGAPRRAHVWYLADARWICDLSTAVRGERALFFLQRAFTLRSEPGTPPAPNDTRATGVPIYRITGWGRGRMPLRDIAGASYADVWLSPVRLPADVEVLPPDVFAFRAVRGWARLDELRPLLKGRAPHAETPGATSPHALLALLHRLEARELSGGPDASQAAFEELSARRDEVRPLLLELLADPGAPYREGAAIALRLEGVSPWLGSAHVIERRAAAWALQSLATEEGAQLTPVATQALALARSDVDAEVRWRLLRALAPPGARETPPIDAPRARALVLSSLSDPAPAVATQAAEALAGMDAFSWSASEAAWDRTRALTLLSGLTSAPDPRTQRAAWAAIGALRGDAAESLLAARSQGLDDLDVVARRYAVASLGTVPGAGAMSRLERLLVHADPWVRGAAVHGLALRRDPKALEVLARALLDPDASVQEGALREIDALETVALGRAAIPGLEAALARTTDSERREWMQRVLAELRR